MATLPDPGFSEFELKMIRTVDVFQSKPGIMKKVEQRLSLLKEHLALSLDAHPGICPREADAMKGQIARGENHNGFPYISLDLPQLFNKELFFTFRTLFWWGHYLGFSLILKGGKLEDYSRHLLDTCGKPNDHGILVSLAAAPWEWELGDGGYAALSDISPDRLGKQIQETGFIKLLSTLDVNQGQLESSDWAESGVSTYRTMTRLIGEISSGTL